MVYGYCRISTPHQKIERQIENICKAYPQAKIYTETFTGTRLNRPEWAKIESKLQNGDTVIFDEVSRMSRDAEEGFALYERLFNEGIELHFLKEPHIDTTTYRKALQNSVQMTGTAVDYILEGINKYLMDLAKEQIKLAFIRSQAETDFLRKRTIEGIKQSSKKSGHINGTTYETKKEKKCKAIIAKHSVYFGGSLSDADCMKLCGCSKNSFYKYKKALSNFA